MHPLLFIWAPLFAIPPFSFSFFFEGKGAARRSLPDRKQIIILVQSGGSFRVRGSSCPFFSPRCRKNGACCGLPRGMIGRGRHRRAETPNHKTKEKEGARGQPRNSRQSQERDMTTQQPGIQKEKANDQRAFDLRLGAREGGKRLSKKKRRARATATTRHEAQKGFGTAKGGR